MTSEIRKLLEEMVERRASDLHITPGVPPQFRIDGTLVPCDRAPLSPLESRELSYAMIDEKRDLILGGGYIPGCDHAIPPDVPWENFRHYRERLAEIA